MLSDEDVSPRRYKGKNGAVHQNRFTSNAPGVWHCSTLYLGGPLLLCAVPKAKELSWWCAQYCNYIKPLTVHTRQLEIISLVRETLSTSSREGWARYDTFHQSSSSGGKRQGSILMTYPSTPLVFANNLDILFFFQRGPLKAGRRASRR